MDILNSDYLRLCDIQLPRDLNRQKYMHTFDLSNPVMPVGFEDYTDTVRILCTAANATIGTAHMTVDEKLVTVGMSQRRPKPHVDGCFMPTQRSWDHGPGPHWAHSCNNVALDGYSRMSVIVASNVIGCRAWRGEYQGQPKSDGDLSHLELGDGEVLNANTGYLLSRDCIHESMIQPESVRRTFLRIALPVDFSFPSGAHFEHFR